MRQGQNNRRGRGRSNRRSNLPNRNQTFDSNGPEVRIRGSAFQVLEKYQALARDATSAGDPVMAENFLQHAEHYQRIINEVNDAHNRAQSQQDSDQQGDGQQSGRNDQSGRDDHSGRNDQSGRDQRSGDDHQSDRDDRSDDDNQSGDSQPGGGRGQAASEDQPRPRRRKRGGNGHDASDPRDQGADTGFGDDPRQSDGRDERVASEAGDGNGDVREEKPRRRRRRQPNDQDGEPQTEASGD